MIIKEGMRYFFKLGVLYSIALFLVLKPTACTALLVAKRGSFLLLPPTSEALHPRLRGFTEMRVFREFSPEEKPQQVRPKHLLDRPATETVFEKVPVQPKSIPPKIVVLGATGKIGRRVIRQLMALESDIKIVAFVRDYEKACDVLYDELLIERSNKGPNLQLVVLDLVPSCSVAGYKAQESDDEDDDDDEEFAVSASKFYDNDLGEYDFRASKEDNEKDLDPFLPLQDAILNATAVISTLGTARATVPFADYMFKPWRIFISAGRWCPDPRHPYYVNYQINKKVLQYCEIVQRQRNKEWRVWENNRKRKAAKDAISSKEDEEHRKKILDKIRIVRISDHCLANQAWDVVNVFTNIFLSMVFRYQEKCEKLLSASRLVDTIILRPGDLVDDIRNETITTMSVGIDGKLPGPVFVGRDDVASLATLAAVSDLDPKVKSRQPHNVNGTMISSGVRKSRQKSKENVKNDPIHWNIAVGWTGESQKGHENAEKCITHIVKEEAKRKKIKIRKQAVRNASPLSRVFGQPYRSLRQRFLQRSTKPHGLFVFLPMLLVVYPTIFCAVFQISERVPMLRKALLYIASLSKPLMDKGKELTLAKLR